MPRTRLLAVGLSVGLIAAACGGDSDDDQVAQAESIITATEATPSDEGPQDAREPDPSGEDDQQGRNVEDEPDHSREDSQQEQGHQDEPEQAQDGPRFSWCEEVLELWDDPERAAATDIHLDLELASLSHRGESYDNDPTKAAPYARAWETLLQQAPELQAAIDRHSEAEAGVVTAEGLLWDIQRAAETFTDINATPIYDGGDPGPSALLQQGADMTRSILGLAEQAGAAPEDVAALLDEVTARQEAHRVTLDSEQDAASEAAPNYEEVTVAAHTARSLAGEARENFKQNMFGIGDAQGAATEALNSNSAEAALVAAWEAVVHLVRVFDAAEALHEATALAERASADATLLRAQFEEDLNTARGALTAARDALSNARQDVLTNEPAVAAYRDSLDQSCRS